MKRLGVKGRWVLGTALLLFLVAGPVFAEDRYAIFSPDKKIKAEVTVDKSVSYSVWFEGKQIIIDSPLGLELKDGVLPEPNATAQRHRRWPKKEKWTPVYGQRSGIISNCNELVMGLFRSGARGRRLRLIFRAYNDGVAFRYYLPGQDQLTKFVLTKENSQFRFAGDHTIWAADYGKFVSHQEEEFKQAKLSSIKPDSITGLPLLV